MLTLQDPFLKNLPPPAEKAKDKNKRWCQGNVGTEHTLVCRDYNEVKTPAFDGSESWRLLVCETCGKELEYYYPTRTNGPLFQNKPPSWVK